MNGGWIPNMLVFLYFPRLYRYSDLISFGLLLLPTVLLTARMLLRKRSGPQRWSAICSSSLNHPDPTSRRSFQVGASPPQPSLHTLPPEILEKIFRSACTDGGRTGCSLSLVSKWIRAASTAARYHSISLLAGSPGKLRAFLECFERARSAAGSVDGSAMPRIRHLCLALYPTTPMTVSSQQGGRVLDLHGWLDIASVPQYADDGWTGFRKHAVNEYHAAVQKLFRMVSEDVLSMCLFLSTEWWEDDLAMPPIACTGFPMLAELSVSGDEPRFTLLPKRACTLDTPFPVLLRLHIVANSHQNVDFQRWIRQIPKLESMRITCGGNVYVPAWVSNLRDAVDNLSETRTMPPRVTVLIRPAFLTTLVGLQHLYHVAAVRMRKHLQQTRVPLVFAPYYMHQDLGRESASAALGPEQLMRLDWLARVDGRQGIFMDDIWTRCSDGNIVDRMRTWWLFGKQYLEPFINL